MKKILISFFLSAFVSIAFTSSTYAFTNVNLITQEDSETVQEESATEAMMESPSEDTSANFTQELKNRFIEGGPSFMGIVLICLILGLAISIERIIYLNLAATDTNKLT